MNKMIAELQKILEIQPTGSFNPLTIARATEQSDNPKVITWVQKFLNSLDHNYKVGEVKLINDNSFIIAYSGKFDRETKELLTYFQKEYWMYKEIPITARLDEGTWVLIAAYMNK